jgi:hypothetical protein
MQGLATSDPGERLGNSVLGAIGGTGMAGAGGASKRLIEGLSRTPSAQRLLDAGIDLTPGQMNASGPMNQFEQASESIPGMKQLIDPARENAERQYQARIIQAGAAPGAPPIRPSENIHDMLTQAYESYAPYYDQAKGYPVKAVIMNDQVPDVSLSAAFDAAAKASGVPKSLQKSEAAWLQDRLTQLPKNPDSADLLELRSDIRNRGRGFALKTDTDAEHIATIADRAQSKVTQALSSQLPAEPLQALSTADSNYGNYKIIENAVAKSKDNLAGLTPQKLSQAVYDATRDGAYARGAGGPLRDLARAGTDVFQNVSPPTGARIATLGVAGAGAFGAPHVAIPTGVGLLGLTATQTGRRLAQGATRPQQLAQAIMGQARQAIPEPARNVSKALIRALGTGASMPYIPAAGLAAGSMLQPKWMSLEER